MRAVRFQFLALCLMTLAVLAGCSGGSSTGGSSSSATSGSGMTARVQLRISAAGQSGLTSLQVQVLQAGSSVVVANTTISFTTAQIQQIEQTGQFSTPPIALPTGESLTIEAQLFSGSTLVASGISSPFTVGSGSTQTVDIALTLASPSPSQSPTATAMSFTVPSTTGPWATVNGGLNTNFQYQDVGATAPVVVNAASGLPMLPGSSVTITYTSGTVSVLSGFPLSDANGDTLLGPFNVVFPTAMPPSIYMPASPPAFIGELVGTFADSTGALVGTPFVVGTQRTLAVPTGASQLQLGINDDEYDDNTGGYNVTVSVPAQVSVTVPGTAGPWQYQNGGLNTSFQYGVGDETAPVVVNQASGLAVVPGSSITVTYASGQVAAGSGFPSQDANGQLSFVIDDNPGTSGKIAPSFFFPPSEYPAYLVELVGVFTDSTGKIVGTPFNIGDSGTFGVPAGAQQLQLGVNDDIYSDNSGSFTVNVSTAAPFTASVFGTSGPWNFTNGGLNTTFQYGVGDQNGPTVVNAANGFAIVPGNTVKVNYVSGLVSPGNSLPPVEAIGDTDDPVNQGTGLGGVNLPGVYIPSSENPVNEAELVGVFTDGSGTIVGSPFVVGNTASLTVPAGASQLELGLEDDEYSDNTGAFLVTISQ